MALTIGEAIEILVYLEAYTPYEKTPNVRLSIGMAIEALKGIKKLRRTLRPYVEALLPGETEG